MDLREMIMEGATQGLMCSQLVMMLTLKTMDIENEDLLRSLYGLGGGIGLTQETCGCMSGGVCAISYFTGKIKPDEKEHSLHKECMAEYLNWFKETMTEQFGGYQCKDIIDGNWNNMYQRCDDVIAASYQKVMEILTEKGIVEL